jgi:hypothetical protein
MGTVGSRRISPVLYTYEKITAFERTGVMT